MTLGYGGTSGNVTTDSTKVPVISKVGDSFRSPNTVSAVSVLGTGGATVIQFSLIANATVNPNVAQAGSSILVLLKEFILMPLSLYQDGKIE